MDKYRYVTIDYLIFQCGIQNNEDWKELLNLIKKLPDEVQKGLETHINEYRRMVFCFRRLDCDTNKQISDFAMRLAEAIFMKREHIDSIIENNFERFNVRVPGLDVIEDFTCSEFFVSDFD